jgi:hypothetical protein
VNDRAAPYVLAAGDSRRDDALPGGVEELFAEQAAYLSSVQGPPDPAILGEIGTRHGAPTLGPPIRSKDAPPEDGAGR